MIVHLCSVLFLVTGNLVYESSLMDESTLSGAVWSSLQGPPCEWSDNGAMFDGQTALMLEADYLPLSSKFSSFAVAFWVKAGPQKGVVYSEGDGVSGAWQIGAMETGNLKVWLRQSDGTVLVDAESSTVVFDDEWHHVVVNHDGDNGQIQIFVDAQTDVEAQNLAISAVLLFTKTTVGAMHDQYFLNGVLAELKLFDHSLTSHQIEDQFSCGAVFTSMLDAPPSKMEAYGSMRYVDDAPCSQNKAVELDADGIFVLDTASTPLSGFFSSFTIAMWIQGNPHPAVFYSERVSQNDPKARYFLLETTAEGKFQLSTHSTYSNDAPVEQVSTQVILDGTWHHVILSIDRGVGKFYVDGFLDSVDFSFPNVLGFTGKQTWLGDSFIGSLADIKLFNHALPPSEVSSIAFCGATFAQTDPTSSQPPLTAGMSANVVTPVPKTGLSNTFSYTFGGFWIVLTLFVVAVSARKHYVNRKRTMHLDDGKIVTYMDDDL